MANQDPSDTAAVLGTGLIGAAVARNLARRGFAVRAWNRTPERAQGLAVDGIARSTTPPTRCAKRPWS